MEEGVDIGRSVPHQPGDFEEAWTVAVGSPLSEERNGHSEAVSDVFFGEK
jgi:hypothetical protein